MMERVIIFGGFDFVGYHLSHYLINEGIETIICDYYKPNQLQSDRFDMIGRNALLKHIRLQSLNNLEEELLEEIDCIYFVYKPYNNGHSISNERNLKELKKAIKFAKAKNAKLVLLSTIPTAKDKQELNDLEMEIEKELLETQDLSFYVIQTPYIYGPWCEENCMVGQLLEAKLLNKEIKLQLEYPSFLYVLDLVKFLYQAGEKSIFPSKVQFLSSEKEQYKKLCQQLNVNLDENFHIKELQLKNQDMVMYCDVCIDLKHGLMKTEQYLRSKLKNRGNGVD